MQLHIQSLILRMQSQVVDQTHLDANLTYIRQQPHHQLYFVAK